MECLKYCIGRVEICTTKTVALQIKLVVQVAFENFQTCPNGQILLFWICCHDIWLDYLINLRSGVCFPHREYILSTITRNNPYTGEVFSRDAHLLLRFTFPPVISSDWH